MKVCQELAKLGHKVTLTVPSIKGRLDRSLDSVWHHYGIQQPFHIRALPAPIRSLSYYVFPRFLTAHRFAWQAVRHARNVKADLVYTRHLPTAVLAARKGMPTIYEMHQVNSGFLGRLSGFYLRLLTRGESFRHFVIITQALKSILLKRYPSVFKHSRIVVAPDGVDIERFKDLPGPQIARERLGLELRTDLVAGYAGSFRPGKGAGFIYELACRCPQMTFLLMGGEPDAVSLYRQQIEQDDQRNLIVTGFIPNAELPVHLAACDVLLLPNRRASKKDSIW